MIQKPITVARRDYEHDIIKATNDSGLPFFIVVEVLEKVLDQARRLADQELKRDLERYNAELSKEQETQNEQNQGE